MSVRRLAAAVAIGLGLVTAGAWAVAEGPREGFAPDPPAHVSDKQWVFELTYDKGASSIDRARSVNVKKAMGTPRQMGRFALELWVGKELLDRARFDVPLLGDDDRERDPKRPRKKPTFARVTAKVKVQMADHPRATVLAFVDRATGDTRRYFWPPDEKGVLTPFSAKAATQQLDAGASDAGDASTGDGGDAASEDAGATGSVSDTVDGGVAADGGAGDGGATDGGAAGRGAADGGAADGGVSDGGAGGKPGARKSPAAKEASGARVP
ncbi:MAG: hypothetical protein R3B70_08760 [Polyangiaceae bacterium]